MLFPVKVMHATHFFSTGSCANYEYTSFGSGYPPLVLHRRGKYDPLQGHFSGSGLANTKVGLEGLRETFVWDVGTEEPNWSPSLLLFKLLYSHSHVFSLSLVTP